MMSHNDIQKLWATLDVIISQFRDIKNLLEQIVKLLETQKPEQ